MPRGLPQLHGRWKGELGSKARSETNLRLRHREVTLMA